MAKWPTAPGDLIYLSDRKLLGLAAQLGVRTGSIAPAIELEGSAGVDAGLPSIGQLSVRGSVHAERTDAGKEDRLLAKRLGQVVDRLGGSRLPSLEDGEEEIREGDWFRFHRKLRFGVGHADSLPSFKALILVDEAPVPDGLSVAGLLLNGSVAHVRAPYATEELRDSPGSRSGSSTDLLFIWLDDARRALETDPQADLAAIPSEYLRSELPPRDPRVAIDMYRVFAEERRRDPPSFPRLLAAGPCEGVAQASFVAAGENATVVMGSPLYVCVCPFPEPAGRSRLRRLFLQRR